ncbi:MBL fold metallo-hydrolase [Aristophania vespae]|uniref:MBL fold metallo-hydrolase n=1 Tax=Aristophania vespae TaxID=2697033 RepID=A0A6P1NJN9_9PROT|nr:MBL fold metallo-hydrolase [Aristophania vespae]QHI95081.1 MBL fold metallo-hydrolase [Aristophania vespae]UMM64270.1 putative metallo-hydrolase [Aristophania vespae]
MTKDLALKEASAQIRRVLAGSAISPIIRTFFDEATFTASHVVSCPKTRCAAVIDSVLDYDPASGRTSFASAEQIVAYVKKEGLKVEWQLETHAHADHLSAAPWLQEQVGGKLAIGKEILKVQEVFGKIFNENTDFARDGSQFDHLFTDGEQFKIGQLDVTVMHVPGHTPADMAFIIGDAAFVGDTIFMPDFGTARADFPGGDARELYRSIKRLLTLPSETRLFLCHDYLPAGRNQYLWMTSVAEQRENNIHVRDGVSEEDFVKMRSTRDKTLSMPTLIMPSVQVNMRGGNLPAPEENGVSYIRIPINHL